MRKVDSAAGYLVKRLRDVGLFEQTNIIFLSDHGMAQLNKSIFLEDYLDTKLFELYGASPTWSVWIKPEYLSMRTKVFGQLKDASRKAHFTVYKRTSIPPEFHYSKSARIGHFFIITDPGYDLFYNKTHMGLKNEIWGNHGWNPTEDDMRPLFMAMGPKFKRDYYHEKPFPNIDLFPLMCYILGLPRENLSNNGTFSNVVDMLNGPRYNGGQQLAKCKHIYYVSNFLSEFLKAKLSQTPHVKCQTPNSNLYIFHNVCPVHPEPVLVLNYFSTTTLPTWLSFY